MGVKRAAVIWRAIAIFSGWLALAGCAEAPAPIQRLALLAPFEGRYREIGYNALYAARLAWQDFGSLTVELLPLDDGGTPASAAERARGLAQDPLVKVVIALGYDAASQDVQLALAGIPLVVVGNWNAQPVSGSTFVLANPSLSAQLSTPANLPVTAAPQLLPPIVGGDVLALRQFRRLATRQTDGFTILSSARLPDREFSARYRASGLYVPPSGLLDSLTYDAAGMSLQAMQTPDTAGRLRAMSYTGLNGIIRFQNGYWADAPIHRYRYDSACLQRSGDELCLVSAEDT